MGRFVNSKTGVVVSVADHKDHRFASPLWSAYDGPESNSGGEGGDGYEAMKVADLKAEIERRNQDRDPADALSVEGRKADLVAALQADDDAARTEQ